MPGKMTKLTEKQLAVVDQMRGGRLLVWSENGAYIEIKTGCIPVDGRTAQGLYMRGLLKSEGGDSWPSIAGLYTLREDLL